MVRQEGFEPPAYCLEGSCSIRLSYWRKWMEQVTESNPHPQLGRLVPWPLCICVFSAFAMKIACNRAEIEVCGIA